MSDAAQPTAAEVRAAAEAVKAALDRHLAAVENRTGDDDPAVYAAFNDLAAAAEAYDERLYDRYDEVTPFEIPGVEDSLPPYAGPAQPNALSVLIRRDYAVADPSDCSPRHSASPPPKATTRHRGGRRGRRRRQRGARRAVRRVRTGRDRLPPQGVRPGGGRLHPVGGGGRRTAGAGEWLSTPFDQADPSRVVCRFDVSAVFDEDELYEEDPSGRSHELP